MKSVRPRPASVFITCDYEVGNRRDWRAEKAGPAEEMARLAETYDARITFFVDVCEPLSLCGSDLDHPEVFQRTEEQLMDLAQRGHDLQVHLHPAWHPDEGCECVQQGGGVECRLGERLKLQDLPPSSARSMLLQGKEWLDGLRGKAGQEPSCAFRAGGLLCEPWAPLFSLLKEAGFKADSSFAPMLTGHGLDPTDASKIGAKGFEDLEGALWELPILTANVHPIRKILSRPLLVSYDMKGLLSFEVDIAWKRALKRVKRDGGILVVLGHTKFVNLDLLEKMLARLRSHMGSELNASTISEFVIQQTS